MEETSGELARFNFLLLHRSPSHLEPCISLRFFDFYSLHSSSLQLPSPISHRIPLSLSPPSALSLITPPTSRLSS